MSYNNTKLQEKARYNAIKEVKIRHQERDDHPGLLSKMELHPR